LGGIPQADDAAVDVGDGAAPAEDRLDVSHVLRLPNALAEKVADPGEPLVVGVDQLLGRLHVQPLDPTGQPVGADAVDDAEIDRLGVPALLAAYLLERHAEDLR